MEWGVGIARLTGLGMAAVMQDYLPRNERSEITDKIASYIRRKGPVKPRDIQQFIKGRLRSPEIKDIVGQLVEAGEVEWNGQGYQQVSVAAAVVLTDPWKSQICDWLDTKDDVSIWDVLAGALGIAKETATPADQKRVAAILDDLGFVQFRPRDGGDRQRRYRKKT
jgi:hypothetical protein